MGIDAYATAIFCATVVYVLRGQGPLGRGLAALSETLRHRVTHDRRVFDALRESAREERAAIQSGLDAYEARSARQDRDLRALTARVDVIEARLGSGGGGVDE